MTAVTRPCAGCGNPTKAHYCGRCVKARSAGGYIYANTHVHVDPQGNKTIELGQECRGESEER